MIISCHLGVSSRNAVLKCILDWFGTVLLDLPCVIWYSWYVLTYLATKDYPLIAVLECNWGWFGILQVQCWSPCIHLDFFSSSSSVIWRIFFWIPLHLMLISQQFLNYIILHDWWTDFGMTTKIGSLNNWQLNTYHHCNMFLATCWYHPSAVMKFLFYMSGNGGMAT